MDETTTVYLKARYITLVGLRDAAQKQLKLRDELSFQKYDHLVEKTQVALDALRDARRREGQKP